MKVLVVDMTHGGIIIASEFSKIPEFDVFAHDIYNTLKKEDKISLIKKGIKLVEDFSDKKIKFIENINDNPTEKSIVTIESINDDLMVVAPIHCNINSEIHMTHHEAVKFLMENRIHVPVIEVTGVKGKTSVVWILKEIFKEFNPLILSSLGVEVVKNGKDNILKRDISIAPASIIETLKLANPSKPKTLGPQKLCFCRLRFATTKQGMRNRISLHTKNLRFFATLKHGVFGAPQFEIASVTNAVRKHRKSSIFESFVRLTENYDTGICIFETSLGGTGLADIGILTNIAENYPIASGKKTASDAKAQIFKSKIVACDFNSFNMLYSDFKNVNTFGNENANVNAYNIEFGIYETTFNVKVTDLKTIRGNVINTSFNVSTFAPAQYHLENVLSAICASLIMEIPVEKVQKGLKNFKGIKGRTSIKDYGRCKIIEEINPGINVTAIKKSVEMVEKFENTTIIFGGKYGITCEEIDEEAAANFFNTLNEKIRLIFTDELGLNIKKKIKRNSKYVEDLNHAIKNTIKEKAEIILLIYRSNYLDINKR